MKEIPLLDLKAQHKQIREEIDRAVAGVLDSADFILGKEVELFEQEVASYTGAKHAIGVANGTDAIMLALIALGIKRGDRVITTAFTYFATAGAIMHAGATPVFVEIDPKTYNILPEAVEACLKKTKDAKAIVPVDLYGQVADMDAIKSIASKYNLKVVEDAAQAFGASQSAKKAGTFGDCGTFSFYPGKNLGADGDAGMIITDDEAIAKKIRLLRNQGNQERYYHKVLGFNSRLDSLQSAILRVKLKYLDGWNSQRNQRAAYYNQRLSALEINTPFIHNRNFHIYHQYVIRVAAEIKDGMLKYLRENGIDSRTYYPIPLHLQDCFKGLGYKNGDLPECEKASLETIALPVYPELTTTQQDFIIEKIRTFLKK